MLERGGVYVLAYSSLPVFLMYFTSAFMAFVVCMMSLRLSLSLLIMVAEWISVLRTPCIRRIQCYRHPHKVLKIVVSELERNPI